MTVSRNLKKEVNNQSQDSLLMTREEKDRLKSRRYSTRKHLKIAVRQI
ncbi:MAG: hypothetical protein VB046_14025 [Paludibacter sp.]|nr:hypothetical protein [Paludibacter sp.]